MKNEDRDIHKELNVRAIVLVGLAIAVFIWTMLYFVDRPNPRRNEETPIQIGLMKPQAGDLWIGADLEDVTPALVAKYELHTDTGVFVRDVIPDAPAQKAGLMEGDVIVSVDKVKIKNIDDLAGVFGTQKAGERLKFRILRKTASKSFNIVLEQKVTQDATTLKSKTKFKATVDPNASPQTGAVPAGEPWLGVEVQSVDAVVMQRVGLPDSNGVLVSNVIAGSPAQTNGIARGDVIVSIDKARVTDPVSFQEILSAKQPGNTAKIVVFRDGLKQEIPTVLAARPAAMTGADAAPEAPTIPQAEVETEASWLSMTIVPLNPAEIKELGLPEGVRGVVIDGVSAGPGFDAGFLIGDIIMSINGMPTTSLREFKDATEINGGALVDIIRAERHRYVTVSPPGFDKQGNALRNNLPLAQAAMVSPIDAKGLKTVVVPAMGQDGGSLISPSFSRAPYLLFIDLDANTINAVPNADAGATGILTARALAGQKVSAVITGRIGPRAFDALNNANITVYAGSFGTVADAMAALRAGKITPSVTVRGSGTAGVTR